MDIFFGFSGFSIRSQKNVLTQAVSWGLDIANAEVVRRVWASAAPAVESATATETPSSSVLQDNAEDRAANNLFSEVATQHFIGIWVIFGEDHGHC